MLPFRKLIAVSLIALAGSTTPVFAQDSAPEPNMNLLTEVGNSFISEFKNLCKADEFMALDIYRPMPIVGFTSDVATGKVQPIEAGKRLQACIENFRSYRFHCVKASCAVEATPSDEAAAPELEPVAPLFQ